jgi:hypothetical protein
MSLETFRCAPGGTRVPLVHHLWIWQPEISSYEPSVGLPKKVRGGKGDCEHSLAEVRSPRATGSLLSREKWRDRKKEKLDKGPSQLELVKLWNLLRA